MFVEEGIVFGWQDAYRERDPNWEGGAGGGVTWSMPHSRPWEEEDDRVCESVSTWVDDDGTRR